MNSFHAPKAYKNCGLLNLAGKICRITRPARSSTVLYIIKFKICAEYRDMPPRPMLFCLELGEPTEALVPCPNILHKCQLVW